MRNILTGPWNGILSWLASCSHAKLTHPFHDEDGDYQRCLSCGGRIQCRVQFGPEATGIYLKSLEEKTP